MNDKHKTLWHDLDLKSFKVDFELGGWKLTFSKWSVYSFKKQNQTLNCLTMLRKMYPQSRMVSSFLSKQKSLGVLYATHKNHCKKLKTLFIIVFIFSILIWRLNFKTNFKLKMSWLKLAWLIAVSERLRSLECHLNSIFCLRYLRVYGKLKFLLLH